MGVRGRGDPAGCGWMLMSSLSPPRPPPLAQQPPQTGLPASLSWPRSQTCCALEGSSGRGGQGLGGPTLLPRLPKSGVTVPFIGHRHCGARGLVSTSAVRASLRSSCSFALPARGPSPPHAPALALPHLSPPCPTHTQWLAPGLAQAGRPRGAHRHGGPALGPYCSYLPPSVSLTPYLQGQSAGPIDSVSPGATLAGTGACGGARLSPGIHRGASGP